MHRGSCSPSLVLAAPHCAPCHSLAPSRRAGHALVVSVAGGCAGLGERRKKQTRVVSSSSRGSAQRRGVGTRGRGLSARSSRKEEAQGVAKSRAGADQIVPASLPPTTALEPSSAPTREETSTLSRAAPCRSSKCISNSDWPCRHMPRCTRLLSRAQRSRPYHRRAGRSRLPLPSLTVVATSSRGRSSSAFCNSTSRALASVRAMAAAATGAGVVAAILSIRLRCCFCCFFRRCSSRSPPASSRLLNPLAQRSPSCWTATNCAGCP